MSQTESRTVTEHAAQVAAHHAGLRVLHIEDNPSDAHLMQEHLRGMLPSVEFDNAMRLADVTASRAYGADCALLDLSLPDASGLEALLALRQLSDRLPIIVLTGFDDMELGLAAVREGADDYLVKNHVDGYTLERAVHYAIERRQLLLRLDTMIADTVITEASTVPVSAAMTAALKLLEETLVSDAAPSRTGLQAHAAAQLDQRSRDLELELQGESGDWIEHELEPEIIVSETTEANAALADLQMIVLNDQRRNTTLLRILQLAKRTLPNVVEASITVRNEKRARTMVFTGPLAVDLDERQFDVGFGPCADAPLTVDPVVVATAEDNPYPHFSMAARRAGITHSVSVALPFAIVGALNLYIASAQPIDPDTVVMAQSVASCAAVVAGDVASHGDAPDRATQMQQTLQIRGTIEQAKGMLMMRNHCSSIEAFDTLTRVSQHTNREIGEIAATLIALTQRSKP